MYGNCSEMGFIDRYGHFIGQCGIYHSPLTLAQAAPRVPFTKIKEEESHLLLFPKLPFIRPLTVYHNLLEKVLEITELCS